MAASCFTSVLTELSVTSAAPRSSKSKLRSHEWQYFFLPSLPTEEERHVSPLRPLPRPVSAPEPCLQPRRGRSLQGSARVSPALALTSLYSHGLWWQGPPLCAHKPVPPTLFVSRNYHAAVLSHKSKSSGAGVKKALWRPERAVGKIPALKIHYLLPWRCPEKRDACLPGSPAGWKSFSAEESHSEKLKSSSDQVRAQQSGDWCCVIGRHSFVFVSMLKAIT